MSYVRFNRHEAYTPEIMDMVREAINDVQSHCIKNDRSMYNSLTNSLFGLYDGYLYDNILMDAIEMDVPQEVFNNLKGIVKATQAYIQLHGEDITLV